MVDLNSYSAHISLLQQGQCVGMCSVDTKYNSRGCHYMAESTQWECRKRDYNRDNYPKEAKVLVRVECLLVMAGVYPGISQATEAGSSV